MYSKQNKLIAAAVLASALATVGCSADMFNQANNTLKTIQTAGKAVGDVRLPTAAIATALGGMELVDVLSKDSSAGIIAAGGGNIVSAGGGNIIAAGGLNFGILQAPDGKPAETPPPIAFSAEEKTVQIDKRGVKATVVYQSSLSADKSSLVSTVKSFTGDTNGYAIKVEGATFTYEISSGGKGGKSIFTLGSGGTLKKGDNFNLSIDTLKFDVQDPMPTNAKGIGDFVLKNGDAFTFKARINIEDSKIKAEATIIEKDKPEKKVVFGEDNPSFTEADVADAQQKEKDDAAAAAAAKKASNQAANP